MYAPARPTATSLVHKGATATLSQAVRLFDTSATRYVKPCLLAQHPNLSSTRHFTTTPRTQIQEKYFPPSETEHIKFTRPAWPHPVYTEEQMNAIKVAHREAKTWSDWTAMTMVRILRWGMDTATGYSHAVEEAKKQDGSVVAKTKTLFRSSPMTERKWLIRFLFLESVAGVPGMVAGSLRHLSSLRQLRRDNGWIETLLEEAYNERMHLLTFMRMAEPGRFMRMMIILTQGVWYNAFFLAYLMSARTCHRFVGYIEEEAVLTYTRAIKDIEAGRLPKWQKLEAPEIAVKYWNMPEGHRSMRDLLNYIRADEAKHREVNHTLGNLEQTADPNPFVSEYEDPSRPHPSKGIENMKEIGWDRKEVI